MSRSVKGTKKKELDYFVKQHGHVSVCRKRVNKTSRYSIKMDKLKTVKDALFELGEGTKDLSRCSVYKSLFPEARTIEYYHHYICGYDVLVVDGKFHGELSSIEELLAFQYHTGESYKDIEDLESKYFEYLENYERWSFLP